jgi:hypothetical protein
MTRRGLALTVAVAVAVSWGWAVGPLPVAEGAEFACGNRVLMDYAQPFERMPHNRLPGESLSFAPRGVELRAGKSVVVEGEPIAYTLVLGRPVSADGRGPRLADLGWVAELGTRTRRSSGPTDGCGRAEALADRETQLCRTPVWASGGSGSLQRVGKDPKAWRAGPRQLSAVRHPVRDRMRRRRWFRAGGQVDGRTRHQSKIGPSYGRCQGLYRAGAARTTDHRVLGRSRRPRTPPHSGKGGRGTRWLLAHGVGSS